MTESGRVSSASAASCVCLLLRSPAQTLPRGARLSVAPWWSPVVLPCLPMVDLPGGIPGATLWPCKKTCEGGESPTRDGPYHIKWRHSEVFSPVSVEGVKIKKKGKWIFTDCLLHAKPLQNTVYLVSGRPCEAGNSVDGAGERDVKCVSGSAGMLSLLLPLKYRGLLFTLLNSVRLFATPRTVAHQPLVLELPRIEYWSG